MFYSIVIPAHNEEGYIHEIIRSVLAMSFPKENFEAIIVENGSTDKTLALARSLAKEPIQVYCSPQKGVSHARNFGATHASKKSDWIIFIDADSILHPEFLNELDLFLTLNDKKSFVGGTATIQPIEKNLSSRFWYWVINQSRKFTKYPWVVQIVRATLWGSDIKYDEAMSYGEDIKLADALAKKGNRFVLITDQVETSTRRFEKVGWLRVLLSWMAVWSLPNESKKKKDYTVIR